MARMVPDSNVVYRCVRTDSNGSKTVGVAWWPRVEKGGCQWYGNDYEKPDWEAKGKVRVEDDRHFIVRDEETDASFEFYPLTFSDLCTTDPDFCREMGIETDLDVQQWWPFNYFLGELGMREVYDTYLKDGGAREDFSDESSVEQPPGVMESVYLREQRGVPAPLGAVRKWCFSDSRGVKHCYFFRKQGPSKWVRLPQAQSRRGPQGKKVVSKLGHYVATVTDLAGSSFAWKESDPSLPSNTAQLHYQRDTNGQPMRDAKGHVLYKPERQEEHKRILNGMFEGRQRSETPTAVFVMGPPASGKSSTKRQRSELTGDRVVSIDPDEIRMQLPEFKEAVDKRVRNAGSITYEETQHLNNKAVDTAIAGSYDFVMDAAGGTSEKGIEWFKKTMADLKARGYTVQVLMHHTPDFDKLLIRNEDRGLRSGRFVPAATIQTAIDNIPKQIAAYEPLVDVLRVFDTSGLDEDPPTGAREVYTRKGQDRRIEDPEFMRDHFLVTEGVEGHMTEGKKRLDMGADAVRDRFLKDMTLDFERALHEPVMHEPNEGVRWEPFDPTNERMAEAAPAVTEAIKEGSLKLAKNGCFYEQQKDGSWVKVDWFP